MTGRRFFSKTMSMVSLAALLVGCGTRVPMTPADPLPAVPDPSMAADPLELLPAQKKSKRKSPTKSANTKAADVSEVDSSMGDVLTATSSYLRARVASQQGDLETAANATIKAFAENPDDNDLRLQAFDAALIGSEIDTALRLAKTFNRTDDPGVLAWLLLGMDALKTKQWDGANAYFTWAEQEMGGGLLHFQVLRNLADVAAGKPLADILKDYDATEVHENLAGHKAYYRAKIISLAGADGWEDLELAYGKEEGSLFTVLALGEGYERRGEKDKAQKVYDTFLASHPEALLLQHVFDRWEQNKPLPDTINEGVQAQAAEVVFSFAMLMWAQQLDEVATELMNMTLWMAEDSKYATLYNFYAGMMDEQMQRWDAALGHYENTKPDAIAGLAVQVRKAKVLFQLNRKAESAALLESLAKRYPNTLGVTRVLAELYYEQDMYAEAITQFDKILADETKEDEARYAGIYFARGVSYERMGDLKNAAKDLQQAIALEPENATYLNYLGYMWLDAGMKIDEAFSMVHKAALLNPTDGSILDSLGWGYYQKGDYAKALLFIEKAAELLPTDPTVVEHMGDVYFKLGNVERAKIYWQQALELGPVGIKEEERLRKKVAE